MKFFVVPVLIGIVATFGFAAPRASETNRGAPSSSPITDHEHGSETAGEHDHEEGESSNVGHDKGVLVASEDLGFKLRPGVEERFGIKSLAIGSGKSKNLPKRAIVYSKEDNQIFRKRDGMWKAIKVQVARKKDGVLVETRELTAGDEVAIEGVGFLKIVELSVFGPAIEGHIH